MYGALASTMFLRKEARLSERKRMPFLSLFTVSFMLMPRVTQRGSFQPDLPSNVKGRLPHCDLAQWSRGFSELPSLTGEAGIWTTLLFSKPRAFLFRGPAIKATHKSQ